MLICEKAAAAERVAASRQSFKDTSKAKEYQHRKDATMDKVNGLILARRAGVGSTGFQVQLLEGNQHAPVLNPSVLSAYPRSHATQPYLWRNHHEGGGPPPSELSYHSNDNRYAGRGGYPDLIFQRPCNTIAKPTPIPIDGVTSMHLRLVNNVVY
jgi:hypothetical protein